MKNFALFLGGCLSLYLAWITGTGEILNYIDFADPLNEMGFFGACIAMGVCCFMACFCKK
jgi:hypothetical protein